MARKKERAGLEPWEGRHKNGQYIRLSYDMVFSCPAWQALTKKQIFLYFLARKQRFITLSNHGKDPEISPAAKWPDSPTIDDECFFLNFGIAVANGWPQNDRKTFSDGKRKLAKIGFIEIVYDAKGRRRGDKSVYRMCDKWAEYKATQKPPKGTPTGGQQGAIAK